MFGSRNQPPDAQLKPRKRHQRFPTLRNPSDQHPSRPSKDRNDSSRFTEILLPICYQRPSNSPRCARVARFLGVCTATVYKWAAEGVLPHVRIVNVIRIRPEDLTRFVNERSR
jgi:excisionase family DNA binding protein